MLEILLGILILIFIDIVLIIKRPQTTTLLLFIYLLTMIDILGIFTNNNTPFIYLLSGILLVYITFMLILQKENSPKQKSTLLNSVFRDVTIISLAEIVLSFNNSNTINAVVFFVLWVAILFIAKYLYKIMENHTWIKWFGGWLLLSVGIGLILKDPFITNTLLHIEQSDSLLLITDFQTILISNIIALIVLWITSININYEISE